MTKLRNETLLKITIFLVTTSCLVQKTEDKKEHFKIKKSLFTVNKAPYYSDGTGYICKITNWEMFNTFLTNNRGIPKYTFTTLPQGLEENVENCK